MERRVIKGYENYEICSNGEIYSFYSKRFLKLKKEVTGYLRVCLVNKDGKKTFLAHRLVAEAFLEKVIGKEIVNHVDGDKTNNDVSNLEWATHKENAQHAHRTGLIKSFTRPVLQFTKTGEFVKRWNSIQDVQKELGFHNSNITNCCRGNLKTSYSFIWEYADKADIM